MFNIGEGETSQHAYWYPGRGRDRVEAWREGSEWVGGGAETVSALLKMYHRRAGNVVLGKQSLSISR